jgi:hypothetical protein
MHVSSKPLALAVGCFRRVSGKRFQTRAASEYSQTGRTRPGCTLGGGQSYYAPNPLIGVCMSNLVRMERPDQWVEHPRTDAAGSSIVQGLYNCVFRRTSPSDRESFARFFFTFLRQNSTFKNSWGR